METTIKEKRTPVVRNGKELFGTWRMVYEVEAGKAGGFGGRLLDPYDDPISGKKRMLVDPNGKVKIGYFIEREITILDASNASHRCDLDFLIGHPRVGIQNNQVGIGSEYIARKDDNPRIKLTNLDYENIQDLEDDEYIDRLIGRLVQDTGVSAISLEKLRCVLATLNFQYKDQKYYGDNKIEKSKLRDVLKRFARADLKNAEQVNKVLDDLDHAKFVYEVKELLDQKVISFDNGMYKYNTLPIGIGIDSVIQNFKNDPDLYAEIVSKLK
jgi:hypothetical protein